MSIVRRAMEEIKGFREGWGNNLDALVDFSLLSCAGLIRALQARNEVLHLAGIVEKRKPLTVLEIGTAEGGTLFLWCHIALTNATIVSVDLPGGMFGGGYPAWKIPLYKSFALPQQTLHLVRADSHRQEILERVEALLSGTGIDFLFIDGDHIYDGVKKDFEMYFPLVKNEGIIAFHDIVPGPSHKVGGVPDFWKEIKDHYDTKEIVEDWNQGECGIGLLFWKEK